MAETAAERRQTPQKRKAARTQNARKKPPSRLMTARTTKASANIVSQASAGLLSIKRINGPSSQNI